MCGRGGGGLAIVRSAPERAAACPHIADAGRGLQRRLAPVVWLRFNVRARGGGGLAIVRSALERAAAYPRIADAGRGLQPSSGCVVWLR